ncbi:unnamed protein product [Heterobilharzia americana]|nr:unnamed protein product [Heterobilharzia americana]
MTELSDGFASLKELEDIFKDRYTDKDIEYQNYLAQANIPPPVIPNWDKLTRNGSNSRAGWNDGGRYRRSNYRRNSLD